MIEVLIYNLALQIHADIISALIVTTCTACHFSMHIVFDMIYMLTTFSLVIMINWVTCHFSDYIMT